MFFGTVFFGGCGSLQMSPVSHLLDSLLIATSRWDMMGGCTASPSLRPGVLHAVLILPRRLRARDGRRKRSICRRQTAPRPPSPRSPLDKFPRQEKREVLSLSVRYRTESPPSWEYKPPPLGFHFLAQISRVTFCGLAADNLSKDDAHPPNHWMFHGVPMTTPRRFIFGYGIKWSSGEGGGRFTRK